MLAPPKGSGEPEFVQKQTQRHILMVLVPRRLSPLCFADPRELLAVSNSKLHRDSGVSSINF
jgi:hypothetical protein